MRSAGPAHVIRDLGGSVVSLGTVLRHEPLHQVEQSAALEGLRQEVRSPPSMAASSGYPDVSTTNVSGRRCATLCISSSPPM